MTIDEQHDNGVAPSTGLPQDDPLLRLRADLEGVTERPLAERAEIFQRAQRVVTNELHKLELS